MINVKVWCGIESTILLVLCGIEIFSFYIYIYAVFTTESYVKLQYCLKYPQVQGLLLRVGMLSLAGYSICHYRCYTSIMDRVSISLDALSLLVGLLYPLTVTHDI